MKHISYILFIAVAFSVSFFYSKADERIKMTYENGVYTMPCEVNGLRMNFIFDTGASSVCISPTEFLFMVKNGYINEKDLDKGYTLTQVANGDIEENMVINLKEVKVGSKKIKNIRAVVSNSINAPLLLGQSVIRRLGSWTLEGDYLILKNGKNKNDETKHKKTITKFTVNGVSFNMIEVIGGTFTMGATYEQGSDVIKWEKPVHCVTLSSFFIGETEVTQELWEAVMGCNPSQFRNPKSPVESISREECILFINKLNKLTGKQFRLPTESEWEYAARGGICSNGYIYSGSNNIGDVAWYKNNSDGVTHPVGCKHPNELGLYDMSGNIWELCSDMLGDYPDFPTINPQGPARVWGSGKISVARGGDYANPDRNCRVAFRIDDAGYSSSNGGFRLAL